jgi:alpha-tubulin suppressor-like RCC1 family protein
MIGVKTLIDKLNAALTDPSLTELEITQLYSAIDSLEKRGVSSVASYSDLPNPVTNKGRFVFIESENRYVMSNGVTWDSNNIITKPYVNAWAWGNNSVGQLGDNTTTDRSSPVSVVGGFTDWVQISVGFQHTAAVRSNGTAWAWGVNFIGQLGNNTATFPQTSPVSVVGGFTDWVQISAGQTHTAAIRANGTAWAWGQNVNGEVGNGFFGGAYSSPISVVGGVTNWVQISAGTSHTAAVRANGTAWAWGANGGRLGDGTITNRSSPVSVVGGFTDWVQISAGQQHTAAIRANGTAWAWGNNQFGRLGDNTTTSRTSPVSVVGGFTDWVQITAGGNHSVAIRANGTAWAWGWNSNGRLGDNTVTSRLSPVSVVGGFTDWVQISAGGSHTVAIRANGTAWAWGSNGYGRLGDNTTTTRSSPVSVVGGFTDWVQISAGDRHTAALRG